MSEVENSKTCDGCKSRKICSVYSSLASSLFEAGAVIRYSLLYEDVTTTIATHCEFFKQ